MSSPKSSSGLGEKPDPLIGMSEGVVTFLDILGWKGIWQRQNDPLKKLRGLLKDIESLARGRSDTQTKSISDTIAIFTKASSSKEEEVKSAIEFHGKICIEVIPRSIELGIPVRGATSYGEYEVDENTFVGKAVDEAAAWHESTDWIGVHLTPSASFVFDITGSTCWMEYEPPFKQRISWKTGCASWGRAWHSSSRTVRDLTAAFRTLGPITPDIAAKFTNSLKFIDASKTGAALEP